MLYRYVMSIAELGSIGELVGAIATVATLAYLAIQIRGSTRAEVSPPGNPDH